MSNIKSRLWDLGRLAVLVFLFGITAFTLWAATLGLPNLDNFEERRILQSTKIYDRTGEVVLFDFNKDVRRTIIPLEDMSKYVQEATIAIEDDTFYQHHGVRPISFIRAAIENVKTQSFSQGGSTITQQVVKNALLTREKSIPRKVKEWILAIRLERKLSKDEILQVYLNENPYGGTIYGVEEAAQSYFGKPASDLTLAEAAYLAALPQAPTYYSPYGDHRDSLEDRKNLVLQRMKDLNFITEEEYDQAMGEKVVFVPQKEQQIKAPHFVFYVRELLEQELGTEAVEKGGLDVITTLDYELQKQAEDIVKRYALENETKFNAENGALVALDPKTGQILTMVGSRDFFDEKIDGQFNAALALRQPGSTFKPFVYATAFKKGYTPETVVFDVPTQFSVNCAPNNFTSDNGCYSPGNYDDAFRGPMTLRNALAQSINVPAVKTFYLAGLEDSAQTARDMGITTLSDVDRYGLTLVLGGGEVRLLDMVGAYAAFANDGENQTPTPILSVVDIDGKEIMKYKEDQKQVLDKEVTRKIDDILTDNAARTPAFGANSLLYFPNHDVAAKTGTTNNYRDAWTIGFTPNIVVGVWAGNNDSSSMEKRVAGLIVTPMWHEFMQVVLDDYGKNRFPEPNLDYDGLKPILRGVWNQGDVHSILHWVDKNDPNGPVPSNPYNDPQYANWEAGVQSWLGNGGLFGIPGFDNDNNPNNEGGGERINIEINGLDNSYQPGDKVTFEVISPEKLKSVVVFINDNLISTDTSSPFKFSFTLNENALVSGSQQSLHVIGTSEDGGIGESTQYFTSI